MPSLAVTLLVPSLVGRSWMPWRWWRKILPTKKPSVDQGAVPYKRGVYMSYVRCKQQHGRGELTPLQLFCTKRGEVASSQLPPCRDCLFLHVEWTNYQAAIWKSSLQSNPVVPSPTKHGWKEDEGKLAIYWMCSPPAPDVVLELLTRNCVHSCKMPSCTCSSNGLACTDMCKLQTCSDQKLQDDPEPDLELQESEDGKDEQFEWRYEVLILLMLFCLIGCLL